VKLWTRAKKEFNAEQRLQFQARESERADEITPGRLLPKFLSEAGI
jgi:hypothetical protein